MNKICTVNNLKFTNIINDNATILLYKEIGFGGVDGSLIADEIKWINDNYPEIKNIDIRINSMGGSVQDGLSICSAILNSSIKVTTWNDGMAYSIAGVILMCGNDRKAADYSTFMMHNVSGGDDKEVLDLLTTSLAKIFERTTNLSLDKCKELMGRETWMDANSCFNEGLIDEIVTTKIKKPTTINELELHTFYNNFLQPTKKIKMLKLTNLLKLSNEASEEAIVEKVEEIQTEKVAADSEIEKLKTEKAELEAKLKAFEDMEIAKEEVEKNDVVENAVKEGKIEADAKDKWINSPLKSIELKNLFETLKTTPAFVNVLDAAKEKGADDAADRSNWTFSDWEKKDSKGLLEIKNSNPTEFERLVKTINTEFKSKK